MVKYSQLLTIDYSIPSNISIKHINHVENEMKISRLSMNLYDGMNNPFIQS